MAELQRKKQKSVGTICKDAIMTGISYMIPVIVGGGVITAIAKMMGGYNIGDTAAEMQTLAQVIFTIGNNLFAFAVPCLAAFIAYAIADKPGIAPGYAMGVLAGLMKTGFVGGLVGALIAGWFVLQMKKIKVPKALQGIMPIMFIPVLSTLIVGLLMWYVIGVPIAWLMGIVTGWLTALSAGSRFVLGAVIGAMIAFDNGGPVNKTAALFVNGLNADGFFIPTSAKMCAGMTSPLGIAISTVLPWSRNKFTKTEGAGFIIGNSFLLLCSGRCNPIPVERSGKTDSLYLCWWCNYRWSVYDVWTGISGSTRWCILSGYDV